MSKAKGKSLVIYQAKSGQIEFRSDFEHETIWGSLNQIADLFGVQKAAISKHLKNIYNEQELKKEATVSILETVQMEGKRQITRKIEYYNLDAIISVGYRINSKQATQFRIWATKTLKQHLLEGYTINKKRIGNNYHKFMQAVADVNALLPSGNKVKAQDVLDLVKAFANTWFSLGAEENDPEVIISLDHWGEAKEKLITSGKKAKQVAKIITQVLRRCRRLQLNEEPVFVFSGVEFEFGDSGEMLRVSCDLQDGKMSDLDYLESVLYRLKKAVERVGFKTLGGSNALYNL